MHERASLNLAASDLLVIDVNCMSGPSSLKLERSWMGLAPHGAARVMASPYDCRVWGDELPNTAGHRSHGSVEPLHRGNRAEFRAYETPTY